MNLTGLQRGQFELDPWHAALLFSVGMFGQARFFVRPPTSNNYPFSLLTWFWFEIWIHERSPGGGSGGFPIALDGLQSIAEDRSTWRALVAPDPETLNMMNGQQDVTNWLHGFRQFELCSHLKRWGSRKVVDTVVVLKVITGAPYSAETSLRGRTCHIPTVRETPDRLA